VRFSAEAKNRTRIELERRHVDSYAARRDEVRGIFDSDMVGRGSSTRSRLALRKDQRYDERLHPPIKLFQFRACSEFPNLSRFCL